MQLRAIALLLVVLLAGVAEAHDTWVQPNTNIVRVGDAVHIDLMLGNHGNEHRDFKLASKIDLERCTLDILAPGGQKYDLKDRAVDTGYAPKEGYWTAKFVPGKEGMYTVAHTALSQHGTTRTIKSGKTYFVASNSLDNVSTDNEGFEQPLGHPLEMIAERNPVTPMGPGLPIAIRVLYRGKPLANARVSFIPRGTTLAGAFDEQYERTTDEEGRASYTPTEGNYFLAVVHHTAPDEKGDGYDRTSYSATLTIYVPEVCPCCE